MDEEYEAFEEWLVQEIVKLDGAEKHRSTSSYTAGKRDALIQVRDYVIRRLG